MKGMLRRWGLVLMKRSRIEVFRCIARGNLKKCKRCQFGDWFRVEDAKRKSCPMTGCGFFVEKKKKGKKR